MLQYNTHSFGINCMTPNTLVNISDTRLIFLLQSGIADHYNFAEDPSTDLSTALIQVY